MTEKTLAQQRAANALENINTLKEENDYGKYASYVKGLPASILMSGIGQASAMLLATAKDPDAEASADRRAHKALYDHISNWLCRADELAPYPNQAGVGLMTCLTDGDQERYMRAQAEVLEYLSWLKKFAVAFLDE